MKIAVLVPVGPPWLLRLKSCPRRIKCLEETSAIPESAELILEVKQQKALLKCKKWPRGPSREWQDICAGEDRKASRVECSCPHLIGPNSPKLAQLFLQVASCGASECDSKNSPRVRPFLQPPCGTAHQREGLPSPWPRHYAEG